MNESPGEFMNADNLVAVLDAEVPHIHAGYFNELEPVMVV